MRKNLKKLNGERFNVTATFERFGSRNSYMGTEKTILLKDLMKDDELLCDHMWFSCGKTFERLDLKEGDKISFDARVTKYIKGYKGRYAEEKGESWQQVDYRLERPTKARKIESVSMSDSL